jgi:two-component system chemotaxis response regulator CheY
LVIDGLEALDAVLISLKENKPYDLICLDIMMPKVDGVKVLKHIKELENQKSQQAERKSKIIMTTALAETKIVQNAFDIGCDAYIAKPIDTEKFMNVLMKQGLIENKI